MTRFVQVNVSMIDEEDLGAGMGKYTFALPEEQATEDIIGSLTIDFLRIMKEEA